MKDLVEIKVPRSFFLKIFQQSIFLPCNTALKLCPIVKMSEYFIWSYKHKDGEEPHKGLSLNKKMVIKRNVYI